MSQKVKLNYLHIGQGKLISLEKVIGIFSIESLRKNKTRDCFLSKHFEQFFIEDLTGNYKKIKSIIFDIDGTKHLSRVNSSTLLNRFEKLQNKRMI